MMTNGMYKIHSTMSGSKAPMSKKEVADAMGNPDTFDKDWKKMRGQKRIVKTRSKTFVLNGSNLAACLGITGKLLRLKSK